MFYHAELERSLKEDLQWLRNNIDYVKNLERDIKDKNNEDLAIYLEPANNSEIRKVIYIINIFLQLIERINLRKAGNNDFKHLEIETNNVLRSLYLPSLQKVYRNLSDYLVNSLEDNLENTVDFSKAEI
ncbi:hypothetical protein [Flavobacterium rhizosphaerae]|uniref:Uncharacterized protein n=1 Tax=Flavobacterium rhizosphaerae TaxID=3163298 RepID=A0ABW8YTF7_9FLAO